jgi:hypothetical protein
MESPELKYTYVDGRKASEFMLHDGIEARYVVHPDGQGGWYDRTGVMVASDATEAGQVSGSDLGEHSARDQGGQKPSSGSSNRVRKSRKKPEA